MEQNRRPCESSEEPMKEVAESRANCNSSAGPKALSWYFHATTFQQGSNATSANRLGALFDHAMTGGGINNDVLGNEIDETRPAQHTRASIYCPRRQTKTD